MFTHHQKALLNKFRILNNLKNFIMQSNRRKDHRHSHLVIVYYFVCDGFVLLIMPRVYVRT